MINNIEFLYLNVEKEQRIEIKNTQKTTIRVLISNKKVGV